MVNENYIEKYFVVNRFWCSWTWSLDF